MRKDWQKKLGFFKRIRNKINITAINIYNGMIKPHFEFGSTIIYTYFTTQQLNRLQKLQNRAIRSIPKCNRYLPIDNMFNYLKWLNIRKRDEIYTLIFIYKIRTGDVPQEFIRNVNL